MPARSFLLYGGGMLKSWIGWGLSIGMGVGLVGCGPSTPTPDDPHGTETGATSAPTAAPTAEPETKSAKEPDGVPTTCAKQSGNVCLPAESFAKKLCNGDFRDLALHLFAKESPWTRAYVNIKEANPWNGFGGSTSDEKLVFDEEVLIVGEDNPDLGGIQVSGNGANYHLLRWDGSCATLQTREVTLQRPPKPKHATINWRILDDSSQEALLTNEPLAKAVSEQKKECKGATMGDVSDKCEKANKKLNDLVVDTIRGGVTVPIPKKVP